MKHSIFRRIRVSFPNYLGAGAKVVPDNNGTYDDAEDNNQVESSVQITSEETRVCI